MRKIAVFIEGDIKEVQLDESILVTGDSYMIVKTATVYWNYNNVFSGYNNQINGFRGRSILTEGYWTFQMLVERFKEDNITGKCSVLHNA